MSTEHKVLMQRYIEIWNTGNLALADELIAPNVAVRFFGFAETEGLEEFKQLVALNRTIFPDRQFTAENIVAEGDIVAVHWSFPGIHKGALRGIAPTGKQVTNTATVFYRISGSKITEIWGDGEHWA